MSSASCDENECDDEADLVCFECSLFLCAVHADEVGGVCDLCGRPMEDA